ncbi:MAG: flagellar basal body-associated FliL family protein [Deltaproteobacteria bacterium]|nr:flagellar basal body-associated FliL family protein [Deltaproteobacteria bacterium]MBW1928483.1 flagellar basal body-associated FliL family protein [Deltaproteobacteria bacterium]MBW2024183.1 flagellar basal body-associated FliL family protein [Deltaproteobacteria bacterium]MBW2124885.1 flagellar basal body-associated FliL family protein [Deltaproteobacteria bacterium]RLB16326.1 MAG: flagellar basal body protein FliL [Deltaproteobacteria bacterium]
MAEEAKKGEEVQEEQAAKKGLPMKLIILVLLVFIMAGGGFFAWKSGMLNKFLGGGEKEAAAKKTEESAKPDIGPIYPMEVFIVNLMDPMGKRYLKAKIELELSEEEMRPEVDKRLPQLRDAILTLLSSKSFKDINDLSGKYQLRAEIMATLNRYLKTGKIKNVYFTEFIVQ